MDHQKQAAEKLISSGLQEYVNQFEHGHPEPVSEKRPDENKANPSSFGHGLQEYVNNFEHGTQPDSEKLSKPVEECKEKVKESLIEGEDLIRVAVENAAK